MHRDTWIGYTRTLICYTIDPRRKFRSAVAPATHITAKGSERYRLFDTIKGKESQKRRRTFNDVKQRDRNRSLNNTDALRNHDFRRDETQYIVEIRPELFTNLLLNRSVASSRS